MFLFKALKILAKHYGTNLQIAEKSRHTVIKTPLYMKIIPLRKKPISSYILLLKKSLKANAIFFLLF